MSDIEADNNNNVSLQREHPEEETESIPNEAEVDNNTVSELDLESLHGSLARRNPNIKLKGANLEWLDTEISDKIVDPVQADVKTQIKCCSVLDTKKRKKCSVPDTKKQEEV